MKLRVFASGDGDCLLLSSKDGHHALIDGGRSESFQQDAWPTLRRLATQKERIDLLVVSHIDADHIGGILWLMKQVAAWTVYDYQRGPGRNPGYPKPKVARPPQIDKVWHNSWRAQLGDLAGEIASFTRAVSADLTAAGIDPEQLSEAATEMLERIVEVAQSIPEGIELLRTVDLQTAIPRNDPFTDLVLLRPRTPHVEPLGAARLTVIGPAKKHLETLREEWREWLGTAAGQAATREENTSSVAAAPGTPFGLERPPLLADPQSARETITLLADTAEIIKTVDPRKVTPPNRASITLLAEEDGRRCLLTGDAAEEELLEGLKAAKQLDQGPLWCDVVKVQHHGSEHNLSQQFASTVLAANYVLCGDGAHGNPDPSVVKTIVETRLQLDPRPFKLWFNSSEDRTRPSRRKALAAAINEAEKARRRNPGMVQIATLPAKRRFHDIVV